MTRVVPAALAVALLLVSSCGRRQESGAAASSVAASATNHAARAQPLTARRSDSILSVQIVPEQARPGTPLRLSATGFSLAKAEIAWTADGDPIPEEHAETIATDRWQKGVSVQARVRMGDRVVSSNTVTLANTPPQIRSVRIVPQAIHPGDSIGVEVVGQDRDGDPVTFEYQWERNGQPAGTGSRMEETLQRGDAISVKITPFDGEDRGPSLVVQRKVENYPPSFKGASGGRMADGVYTCRVEATDGDGDPLTYALVNGPPGMTIDPDTGAIRWAVPDGLTGKEPFTVSVTDGHGGKATYPMFLTIREEPSTTERKR